MANLRSTGKIVAGRDMNIADNGSTIRQDNTTVVHGGSVNKTPPKTTGSFPSRLIQVVMDAVRWWRGPRDPKTPNE